VFRAILSVGGWTLISRVTGFIRDVLTASFLGAGPVADAFFVALRLPNHFRTLFAEGAFNNAFVPLYSATLTAEGREAARRFADQVLTGVLIAQTALLLVVIAVMPGFMTVFAPGLVDDPVRFDLAVDFTRVTFPYLAFMALEVLLAGALNSVGKFHAAAAAPILLNVCMIAALLLFGRSAGNGGALSWSVTIAGAAQFGLLWWAAARAGYGPRLARPTLSPHVRRFLKVLGPVLLGAGVSQLSVLADTFIASWLPTGAMSHIYYADRLNQLPLGVIGIAVGTVLLPELTRLIKSGDESGASEAQNRALEFTLLMTLPAAAAFLAVGEPIVAALFQHGRFDAIATHASAETLRAYALGLPAVVVTRSLVTGFYARHDTSTPVRIAVVAVAVNIALKIALMGPLAQVGLAFATSVGAWINVMGLAWALRGNGWFRLDARSKRNLPRLILAAVATGLTMWVVAIPLSPWFAGGSLVVRVASITALCAAGGIVQAGSALALGLFHPSDLKRFKRRVAPRA